MFSTVKDRSGPFYRVFELPDCHVDSRLSARFVQRSRIRFWRRDWTDCPRRAVSRRWLDWTGIFRCELCSRGKCQWSVRDCHSQCWLFAAGWTSCAYLILTTSWWWWWPFYWSGLEWVEGQGSSRTRSLPTVAARDAMCCGDVCVCVCVLYHQASPVWHSGLGSRRWTSGKEL